MDTFRANIDQLFTLKSVLKIALQIRSLVHFPSMQTLSVELPKIDQYLLQMCQTRRYELGYKIFRFLGYGAAGRSKSGTVNSMLLHCYEVI